MNRFKAMGRIWNRSDLTPEARLTAMYLADRLGEPASFRVKLTDIAEWVNCFPWRFDAILHELSSAGFIEYKYDFGDTDWDDWSGDWSEYERWHVYGQFLPPGTSHPPKHRRHAILRKTKGKCFYCGHEPNPCDDDAPAMHVDHMHPKSRGGSNAFTNLVGACEACNLKKRDRTVGEFRRFIEAATEGYDPERDGRWVFHAEERD